MKNHVNCGAVLFLLLLSGVSMANTWIGGAGDWATGANWDTGSVPDAGDQTHINTGATAQASVSTAGALSAKLVMENGSGLTLASGGNLAVGGQALLGNAASSVGSSITVEGGQLSVATEFALGVTGGGLLVINTGTVNANGAWLIPGYQAGSTGDIVVNGGALNTAGPLYTGFNGDGSLTVNGGNVNLSSHLIVGANAGSIGDVIINSGVTTATALNFSGAGVQSLDLNGGQLITTGGFEEGAGSTFYIGSGELVFNGGQTLSQVQGLVAGSNWIFDDTASVFERDGAIVVTSSLDLPTNVTITAGSPLGDASDAFQNATVTSSSAMHPSGFLAEDLFSGGAAVFAEDVVFADGTGSNISFVEFNISSPIALTNIVVGLANDEVPDAMDNRTLSNIKVYAGLSAETVMDTLVADIAVDPEYTTAYGSSSIVVEIAALSVTARYFRVEFTEPLDSGVRVYEIDGYGGEYIEPVELPALYTPAPSFDKVDHVVSTSLFHWYTAVAGQLSGPWLPLEGRPAWTGTPDWWQGQIKQMMMANIDILNVHLIPSMEQQRINLFQALNQLRYEGYDVPKVVPFLDPLITWNGQPKVDVATTAGKDEVVDQYIRFFNQYYSVNQDTYADDYLAKFDNQVVLDTWHVHLNLDNVSSLTRQDVTSRLVLEFGPSSPFTNEIYMVTTAYSSPALSFSDEKVAQFEIHSYFDRKSWNGIEAAQVKPGYWDQNIRNPGYLLPRDGGSHYAAAWSSVNGDSSIDRVYIESFNEYDEGSGIYAVDVDNSPWIKPGSGNTGSDTWSGTDDPYEYLRTTAAGAAAFNDTPDRDAKILWHNFPTNMYVGETQLVTVVMRNTGDASWTAAANYKFGDKADGAAVFGDIRYLIDDTEDEIPVYGGIFRGRAKPFQLTLVAPLVPGTYETHWGMVQEYIEWFGEDLARTIIVAKNPATVLLGDLLQTYDGSAKPVSSTTDPVGLAVDLTYDGSTSAPTNEGSYTVVGTIDDPAYQGSATKTLVIQMPAAYDEWKAVWFTPEQQADAAVSGPEVYFDSDAFSNWEEYIGYTDPTDGQAFPRFQMQPETIVPDGQVYILSWASVSGRVYSVDWSSDLMESFVPMETNLVWPQTSYTDVTHQAEEKGFYQMGIRLP